MAMDGARPMRSGPKPPLAWSGAAQGRDGDLVCLFLWHAMAGDRTAVRNPLPHALWAVCPLDPARPLAPHAGPAATRWRRACGDAPEPSAVVIDRKKIRGVKIHVAVDKYGIRWRSTSHQRTGMIPSRPVEVKRLSGCKSGLRKNPGMRVQRVTASRGRQSEAPRR
jgi:hypothetical protein